MSRLVRSLSAEVRKVSATKTWWVLALVLAGYAAMMSVMFAFLLSAMGEAVAGSSGGAESLHLKPVDLASMVYSTVTSMGYVVPLLLGALAATGELRHHTLGFAFTIEPKRQTVLVSKFMVMFGLGLVVGLIGLIVSAGAGAGTLAAIGGDIALGESSIWMLMARVVLATALWTMLGFSVGVLLGNQAAAIVIALVFTQFLEPILRLAAGVWDWSASLGRFLPGSATDAFVGASIMNSALTADPSLPGAATHLTHTQGFLVLLAYVVVLGAIGWALRWRKDLTS